MPIGMSITLSILGLLPSDFNLLTYYEDLYSEQIAGYYDDETKEMYVVSGSGFSGPGKNDLCTRIHSYSTGSKL